MSHEINERWLTAASENFQTALEAKDYALARAVLADLRENGFTEAAGVLEEQLSKHG